MLPLSCLPLWGRGGVTLLAAAENKRITGKRGFQQSRKNRKIPYKNKAYTIF
jgi:hypothetical protein